MDLDSKASDELLVRREGRIEIFTINRPHRANSITPELATALSNALLEADRDKDVSAIVITGAGDKAFSTGMDLKAAAERMKSKALRSSMRGSRRSLYEILLETWKPTIAAIEGFAVGGGLELALACDLRVAARDAKLGAPEAKRGLAAHFATVLLPRAVPQAIAFELLFTGELISGSRAAEVGLVNRATAPGEALGQAIELGRAIAANAPLSLRRIKETVIRASGLPLATALRLNEGSSPLESEDRIEGIRAFNEKRAPEWKGR